MDFHDGPKMNEAAPGYTSGVMGGPALPQGYGAAQAGQRPQTPAECVRDNADRAVARLGQLRSQVLALHDRLCGSVPKGSEQAGDTLSASGFVAGTSSAVERIHIEISAIDEVLASIAQVI